MIVPTYTSGDWFAIVSDGCVVLLPPETSPQYVAELWTSVRSGGSVTDHLALLTRDGFMDLPPFALVGVRGASAHVVVRGGPQAEVVSEADVPGRTVSTTISAREVATWSEQVLPRTRSVVLRVGDDAVGQGELPVLSGVVRAAAVRLDLVADDAGRRQTGIEIEPEPVREPVPDSTPSPEPMPVPVPAPVPALELAPASEPPMESEPEPEPEPEPQAGAGSTTESAYAGLSPFLVEGDHDGMTVLGGQVAALRSANLAAGSSIGAGLILPPVLSAVRPAAPRWQLTLSTGVVLEVDRTVLIGRSPQARRVQGPSMPHLLSVPSPQQDISRTHVEIRTEGDEVLVTDLGSTNGTTIVRGGHHPQRLHAGEPAAIGVDVVVDLGEGVTFTVQEVA